MKHTRRGFTRYFQFVFLGCIVVFFAGPASTSHAASPSTELKRIFSKMDRQLCQSLSLVNCKRLAKQKKRKTNTSKGKAKTVKSMPGPVTTSTENKAKDSSIAPLPTVAGKDTPPTPPVEKLSVPLPTLKPAAVLREAKAPSIPTPVEKKPLPEKPPEIKVVILPAPVKLPLEKQPETKVVVLPVPIVLPPKLVPPSVHGMPDGTLVGEACYDSLRNLGVNFTQPATPVGTGLCSVSDAVHVQSVTIGSDIVKLSDQPTFNCGFAFKFASWLKVEASPIVTRSTGKTVAAFGTGPGFQCRGRNGDITAKLSEHAFGNAVDIERIKLSDGEVIDVKDAITFGAKFQPALAALRASACQYFTTVLGPGTNAAHASHFHFDLERRGKKGNHSMCQ